VLGISSGNAHHISGIVERKNILDITDNTPKQAPIVETIFFD
jgi:hypothetical protein